MNAELISVMLVEDDPADVLLVRDALEYHKVADPLSVLSDGIEAMRYLRREDPYREAVRPHLILLDLGLPRKSGPEVLSEIRSDPALRAIPVVTLTSSIGEEDMLQALKLHAEAIILKPVSPENFMRIAHEIESFYVALVRRAAPREHVRSSRQALTS